MDVGVQVSGLREFDAALDAIARRVRVATRQATSDALQQVRQSTQMELYRSAHPPGTRTPSMPGSPPSLIGGALRDSVRVTGPVASGSGWSGRVGPTSVYGRIQELGGVTGRGHRTRLPPRPYLLPTFDRLAASGALRRTFSDRWQRAIRP